MACTTLTANDFKDKAGKSYPVTSELINPARKTNTKMMSLTDGNSLLDAKTQKGERLIEPGSVSQNDADQAASMITQLNQEQLKQDHKTTSIRKQSAFVRFLPQSDR